MKTSIYTKGLIGAALLAASAAIATADPIKITTLDITAFDPYGDAHVAAEITDAINDWNALYDPDLPVDADIISPTPNQKYIEDGENVKSITITGLDAYTYIFFHWGGPDADVTYDNPQLFYLNGVSEWTFTAPVNTYVKNGQVVSKQYGLSFYSLYGVPDGGTTLLMLGATVLLALGISNRLNSRRGLSFVRKN